MTELGITTTLNGLAGYYDGLIEHCTAERPMLNSHVRPCHDDRARTASDRSLPHRKPIPSPVSEARAHRLSDEAEVGRELNTAPLQASGPLRRAAPRRR
jgi:hypothetical protein